MRYGIAGGPLPSGLPYGEEVESAAAGLNFSPLVAYAIKQNETGPNDPPDVLQQGGNGHGIFQLDSSYPSNWQSPWVNANYAIAHFMLPAEKFWVAQGLQGDELIRAIAAQYNAGQGAAWSGHLEGDVDRFTTNRYGERALANYHALLAEATK